MTQAEDACSARLLVAWALVSVLNSANFPAGIEPSSALTVVGIPTCLLVARRVAALTD